MPVSVLSRPARHIAASIGSIEKIGTDTARERLSASTVLPEPGSPDKTIRVGDIFVISVISAFENGSGQPPRAKLCRGDSWPSSHISHRGGGLRKRQERGVLRRFLKEWRIAL